MVETAALFTPMAMSPQHSGTVKTTQSEFVSHATSPGVNSHE
jgi:hypothetical protein